MDSINLYDKVIDIAEENSICINNIRRLKRFCDSFSQLMEENFADYYEIEIIDAEHIEISAGDFYSVIWYANNGIPYCDVLNCSDGFRVDIINNRSPDGYPFRMHFTLEV